MTCSERKLRPQKKKQKSMQAENLEKYADHNPTNPLIEGAMLARFSATSRQLLVSASYCARMTLHRRAKKLRRVPLIFLFSVQTKLTWQIPEFLLTKDRGIAVDVCQELLRVDLDDKWFVFRFCKPCYRFVLLFNQLASFHFRTTTVERRHAPCLGNGRN